MGSTGSTDEARPTWAAPRVVEGAPHALPMLLKAALPSVPGLGALPGIRKHGSELPDLALTRHDVPIDPGHVAAYADVCGFPHKDTVPLTYPHMLAFGLHMAIMTDSSFPFPAIGTVHLENAITQHRPVTTQEKLQVTARAENLRPHAKGQVFGFDYDELNRQTVATYPNVTTPYLTLLSVAINRVGSMLTVFFTRSATC